MSVRETALASLSARLGAALAARSPAPKVLRNETVPQRLPAGGLVVVRDGETVEETAILSPLAWAIEHRAEVEVVGTTGGLRRWLRVAFATAQTVRQYGIRARASFASSDSPRTFTFEGWDGAAWAVLDSRVAETGWSNGQLRTFTLAAPASCTEFRLVVTAGSGGGNTGLAELELYRTLGGPNIAASTYAQAVIRTIAVTAPSATYAAANQTTDFGAAQAEVFVRLQQMSALVGRGLPAEATL